MDAYRLIVTSEMHLSLREVDIDDLVESLEVRIVRDGAEEEEVSAGKAELFRVRLDLAHNEGLNALEACDAVSQDLCEYAEAVLDPATGALREEICDDFDCIGGDLLVIHLVEILPAHRGSGLGLWVVRRLIEYYGTGLVICRPQPLQYVGGSHVGQQQRSRDPAMEYGRFPGSKALAKTKLRDYWRGVGFEPIGDGEFFVLSAAMRLPDLS